MKDADMKEKIGWNPTSVLNVLHKEGGDLSRPFYHPDATEFWLAGEFHNEIKLLAETRQHSS
jgi:hypothetical protein